MPATLLAGQAQQAHVQVAAGVQGDHGFVAVEVAGAVGGHHVLMHMACGQMVVLTQGLASGDELGVVFQAGQLLARLQQAAA
ncbi:hypothetical protein D3C79_947450 [compost metagenome]